MTNLLCLLTLLSQTSAATDDQPCQGAEKPPVTAGMLTELTPDGDVVLAVDGDSRSVWVRGCVVLREGVLEMLICGSGTKEHESIVAVPAAAEIMQSSLIAAGFEPGQPVRFDPDFIPPTGDKLQITMHWVDGGKPRSRDAKQWVRNAIGGWHGADLPKAIGESITLPEADMMIRYIGIDERLIYQGPMPMSDRKVLEAVSPDPTYQAAIAELFEKGVAKPLDADWVFAGSTWSEALDGTRTFDATSGNYVCVANFSDAIIDIDEASSSSNGSLLYEPWTERIPPIGTTVWIHFEKAPTETEKPKAKQGPKADAAM